MNIVIILLKKHGKSLAILLFALYVLKTFKSLFSDNEEVETKWDEEEKTLSTEVISDISNKLYHAMVTYRQVTIVGPGTTPATDEKEVYAQLSRLKNQNDFNAVYNKFGRVPYNATLGMKITPFDTKHDLSFILNKELTDSEKEYISITFPHLSIF